MVKINESIINLMKLGNKLGQIKIPNELGCIQNIITIQQRFSEMCQIIANIAQPYLAICSQMAEAIYVPNNSLAYRMNIAEKGWVLPLEFENFDVLANYPSIDEGIVEAFEQSDLLEYIKEKTLTRLIYPSHIKQYEEAIKCFDAKLYTACIYSLFPVIEGLICNTLNPKSVKILNSLKIQTDKLWNEPISNTNVHMLILFWEYMEKVFAIDVPFDNNEPVELNRNWLAHGKYKNKTMTNVDCLKLFCAISAMTDVIVALDTLKQEDVA